MGDMRIGAFKLESPIAEGGMGSVWLATHEPSNTPVAVKVLTSRTTQRPRFRQTFRNEARAMSGLNHANIAQIFDYGEIEPDSIAGRRFGRRSPYLVMEYLPWCVAEQSRVTDWNSLREFLLALLDALAHAHARGVIHRDLKPNNLLMDSNGILKLSDFGIAFTTEHSDVDVEQLRAAGTPEYMAPEQCHGMWRDFGPWTDLYGVGCVVHAILTGTPPFMEDHPMGTMLAKLERSAPILEPRFEVPEGFPQWVHKLLKRSPNQRFQRAADASWALRSLAFDGGEIMSDKGDIADISCSDYSIHDTAIGNGFDTMMGFEKLGGYEVTPNFEGTSTGLFRLTKAPIPLDWRSIDKKHRPPPVDAGLALYSLRKPNLVGREGVRDELWSILREVHTDGIPQCVLLRGHAGVGKSRTAEWLCERAHEAGVATILHAHHSSDPGPASGLAPMLLRYLRCSGLPRIEVRERIAALLDDPSVVDSDGINALTEFVMPAQSDEIVDSSDGVRFFSVVERHLVLAKHLEHLAAERTVILWLDDVHWGQESLEFVHWLLKRKRCAFLVLMTAADEYLDEKTLVSSALGNLMLLEGTKTISLNALPNHEQKALIGGLLHLDEALAHAVEKKTDGNPLFAIHMIQDWISRGLLIPSPTGFIINPDSEMELPDDLTEVWSARVERTLKDLSDHDVQGIELAAVLGHEINGSEWDALCEIAGLHVTQNLSNLLMKDGLIALLDETNPEGGWGFVHSLLRDALYDHARVHGRLDSHHGICLVYLRTRDAGDPRIPRHLCAMGQHVKALKPYKDLLQGHLAAGNHVAASGLLQDWRNALKQLGDTPKSRRWLESDLMENNIASLRGELISADVGIDTLIRRLNPQRDGHLLSRAMMHRGRIAIEQGRFTDAMTFLAQCIENLSKDRAPRTWAWSHWYLANALGFLGHYNESKDAFDESEGAFLGLGNTTRAALCLLGKTRIAQHRGEQKEAELLIESASHELSRSGDRAGIAATIHARAELHRLSGDLSGAENLYRQAQARYATIGSSNIINVELDLTSVLLEKKAFLEATLILEKILEQTLEQGRRVLSAQSYINLLLCDADRRDWHAWDLHLGGATELLKETQTVGLDLAQNVDKAGQMAAEAGHYERAYACFTIAKQQWKAMNRNENVDAIRARIASLNTTLGG